MNTIQKSKNKTIKVWQDEEGRFWAKDDALPELMVCGQSKKEVLEAYEEEAHKYKMLFCEKESSTEWIEPQGIEDMEKMRDYLNRELTKYYEKEQREKLKKLDEEYLGKMYKIRECHKVNADYYKIISVAGYHGAFKALRIACPEAKWIAGRRYSAPLSDGQVVFHEENFATLEELYIRELQEEYQEIGKEEWDTAYNMFVARLKEFSEKEIGSDEIYQ